MKVTSMAEPTSTDTTSFDTRAFRNACGAFATGVTVVTTTTKDGHHGMTANAFMSVSLEPPLIAVSIRSTGRMIPKIRETGRYAVNILSDQMEDHALHFSGRHRPHLDDALQDHNGFPILPDCAGRFLTDVVNEFEVGDHVLFIGHVREFHCDPSQSPLLFSSGQFRTLPSLRSEAAE